MLTFLPFLYKDRHLPEKEEIKMPLVCIAASNRGLLLGGYFNSFDNHKLWFVNFIIVLGQVVYLLALSRLPSLLKLSFYLSFTFPFVINATALKLSNDYFGNLGMDVRVLGVFRWIETGIAVILVFYALFSYIKYLATE